MPTSGDGFALDRFTDPVPCSIQTAEIW